MFQNVFFSITSQNYFIEDDFRDKIHSHKLNLEKNDQLGEGTL